MLAKMFAGPVKASFHGSHTGAKGHGDFSVTAAFLDQREERAVLRADLGQRVPQRIEFLGVDGARRLRDVFVFRAKREKDPAQLLPAEVIDAGVAREPEEPRLELRRSLQAVERADHLDENLLGQVLDGVAAIDHGIHESSHAVLVADNELALGPLVTALSAADELDQLGRFSGFHVVNIAVPGQTQREPERYVVFDWRKNRRPATLGSWARPTPN